MDTPLLELLWLQQMQVILFAIAFDPLLWMGRAKQLALFGASFTPAW